MDYIRQHQAFLHLTYGFPSNAVSLYLRLFEINNRLTWRVNFPVTTAELALMTGIKNQHTIEAARNKLIQAGLITYKSQGQGKPGIYSLPILYETSAKTYDENANVSADVSANINKLNKTKLNKTVSPVP